MRVLGESIEGVDAFPLEEKEGKEGGKEKGGGG